jgi:hypothetical protein
VNHTDVISTLLQLSRPPAPADRLATYQKLLARVGAVQAPHAQAHDEHHALAELLATLDMRALIPKITPEAYPTVGRLFHAGTALRDHLDGDLRDLRAGVRAAREALVGPASQFTSTMQTLERDVERNEGSVLHMATLVKVIEFALNTLVATPFTSDEFIVPPLNNQPAITAAS